MMCYTGPDAVGWQEDITRWLRSKNTIRTVRARLEEPRRPKTAPDYDKSWMQPPVQPRAAAAVSPDTKQKYQPQGTEESARGGAAGLDTPKRPVYSDRSPPPVDVSPPPAGATQDFRSPRYPNDPSLLNTPTAGGPPGRGRKTREEEKDKGRVVWSIPSAKPAESDSDEEQKEPTKEKEKEHKHGLFHWHRDRLGPLKPIKHPKHGDKLKPVVTGGAHAKPEGRLPKPSPVDTSGSSSPVSTATHSRDNLPSKSGEMYMYMKLQDWKVCTTPRLP